MKTLPYRQALAFGSLLFAFSVASQAQDDRVFALRLTEEAHDKATLTTFTIEQGELRAIALFSEPSHTLVALISDNSPDAGDIRDAAWFKAEVAPHLDGISSMGIPLQTGAAARVQTAARPTDDTRIVAWVDVRGEAEPHRVELQVGPGFDVSVDVKLATYTVKCGEPGSSCGDSITCSAKGGSISGTCCLKSNSQCGHCRKSVAHCGLLICDLC